MKQLSHLNTHSGNPPLSINARTEQKIYQHLQKNSIYLATRPLYQEFHLRGWNWGHIPLVAFGGFHWGRECKKAVKCARWEFRHWKSQKWLFGMAKGLWQSELTGPSHQEAERMWEKCHEWSSFQSPSLPKVFTWRSKIPSSSPSMDPVSSQEMPADHHEPERGSRALLGACKARCLTRCCLGRILWRETPKYHYINSIKKYSLIAGH